MNTNASIDWKMKRIWQRRGTDFLIEISCHTADARQDPFQDPGLIPDNEGIYRWCVYAYIYPKHPYFYKFDDSDAMWQPAAQAMPLHRGPSYFRRHIEKDGNTTSIQVGADYHHYGDSLFTQQSKLDGKVLTDAGELFNWLEHKARKD